MRTIKLKLNDTITGLTNTSWDPENVVSGRAATEDQLAAATMASTPTMASWHTFDTIGDVYDVGRNYDIKTYITNIANNYGSSGIWGLVKPKPLEISVSDYEWEGPNTDARNTAIATVKVSFPDGSSLVKEGVTFISEYDAPNRVYAAKLSTDGVPIDTGLKMNSEYRFEATGCTQNGNQSVLVGAIVDTNNRTTLRILGGSAKLQGMWPSNSEYLASTGPFNFREMFSYSIDKSGMQIKQGDIFDGQGFTERAISGDANIYLFGESTDRSYRHGIIREVRIYDGDNLLKCYQAVKHGSDIIMKNVIGTDILIPSTGYLEEVTE